MLNFGVVGYGYWGPNIVRNLMAINGAQVKVICDSDPKALNKASQRYPHIETSRDFETLIQRDDLDAVAIVTPVHLHYPMAKKALEFNKHIFIEKPFTQTSEQAKELIRIAKKNKRQIMVDHTFLFTAAVRKIKEVLDSKELGNLNYYDSTRVSLGLFQHDTNVIWDLAPHDFSIIDYVIKNKPISISAQGMDHVGEGHANIAYITMMYEQNLIVHINVNWLSPTKIRNVVIGGQKKMLIWDDLSSDEKIKVYNKGIQVKSKSGIHKMKVDYRMGDMFSPHLDMQEALDQELRYFIECIANNVSPINDGLAGLRVVEMLEKADESLRANGKAIKF